LYNPALAATFDSSGNICSAVSNPPCAGGPSPGLGISPNPILAGLQFYENGIGIGGVNGIPKGLTNNYWPAFGPVSVLPMTSQARPKPSSEVALA
jgi:hypothetical protein